MNANRIWIQGILDIGDVVELLIVSNLLLNEQLQVPATVPFHFDWKNLIVLKTEIYR
jgi:hypothetical protein